MNNIYDSERDITKFCTTEIKVIYGDTDAMGVVYYANYLRWFEIGRTEYFRKFDYPPLHYVKKGFYLPAVEVACRYYKPALYDDTLIIETSLGKLSRVTLRMDYAIIRKNTEEIITTGASMHALINSKGELISFPKEFIEKMKNFIIPPHKLGRKRPLLR